MSFFAQVVDFFFPVGDKLFGVDFADKGVHLLSPFFGVFVGLCLVEQDIKAFVVYPGVELLTVMNDGRIFYKLTSFVAVG